MDRRDGNDWSVRRGARRGVRVVGVAVAVVALLAGQSVTAAAAAPVPPTSVAVRWDDGDLRITWQGGSGVPRGTIEQYADGNWNTRVSYEPPNDDGPRTFSYGPSRLCCNHLLRVGVRYIDGEATSPTVYTETFDSNAPAPPQILFAYPQSDETTVVTWSAPPPSEDTTPGDPLDLPTPSPRRYALVSAFESDDPEFPVFLGGVIGSATGTRGVGLWGADYIAVGAINEWNYAPITDSPGFEYTGKVDFIRQRRGALTGRPPLTGTYGIPIRIAGTTKWVEPGCDRYSLMCRNTTGPSAYRKVVLQARSTASSAWYPVTSATSNALGDYVLQVKSPGTREYRLLMLGGTPYPVSEIVYAGSFGGEFRTITYRRVVTARFLDSTVSRGSRATAYLSVSPSGGRATLQRWTGSRWTSLKWIYLPKGVGSYTFTTTTRAKAAYRFVVTATAAPNGLPVAGRVTPTFFLTTR